MRAGLRRSARGAYARYGKRAADIALALLLLPIVLPIIGALWVMTRADGGPGFFGHRRIGRRGRTFRCWKIRTMVVDAEARLSAHLAANPAAALEWARDFKLERDPRVTRLGAVLRATSLDELPQIWNVLRGEMSFVGPRPVVRAELCRYGRNRTAYLALKPGITGLWQVSGRNDVSYESRVRMDVDYLSRISLGTDLRLVARTIGAVLGRTGR
ncbi:sugar transferase [Roseivivax jejudonensis]|uniref:sugar transferase n=1 Tax=Roseivivax jejudonensis TaxID=1529041 RepID=UPI000A2722A4|nr:sugar transferase [Roseivivax jejudonensis]